MHSLISADDHVTLWAIIALGTALAIWLEQSYRWAARLSGPVLALLIAMGLSNTRIVNANLGGAPRAAAMAIGAGWPRLVLPGIWLGSGVTLPAHRWKISSGFPRHLMYGSARTAQPSYEIHNGS